MEWWNIRLVALSIWGKEITNTRTIEIEDSE